MTTISYLLRNAAGIHTTLITNSLLCTPVKISVPDTLTKIGDWKTEMYSFSLRIQTQERLSKRCRRQCLLQNREWDKRNPQSHPCGYARTHTSEQSLPESLGILLNVYFVLPHTLAVYVYILCGDDARAGLCFLFVCSLFAGLLQ